MELASTGLVDTSILLILRAYCSGTYHSVWKWDLDLKRDTFWFLALQLRLDSPAKGIVGEAKIVSISGHWLLLGSEVARFEKVGRHVI